MTRCDLSVVTWSTEEGEGTDGGAECDPAPAPDSQLTATAVPVAELPLRLCSLSPRIWHQPLPMSCPLAQPQTGLAAFGSF